MPAELVDLRVRSPVTRARVEWGSGELSQLSTARSGVAKWRYLQILQIVISLHSIMSLDGSERNYEPSGEVKCRTAPDG